MMKPKPPILLVSFASVAAGGFGSIDVYTFLFFIRREMGRSTRQSNVTDVHTRVA